MSMAWLWPSPARVFSIIKPEKAQIGSGLAPECRYDSACSMVHWYNCLDASLAIHYACVWRILVTIEKELQ